MQLDFRDALSVFDRNRRADGYTQEQHKLSIKRAAKSEGISFVNKGQNILHQLSLDANSMAIYYWQALLLLDTI